MKYNKHILLFILCLHIVSCGTMNSWASTELEEQKQGKVAFLGVDVREILSNKYSENIDKQFSDSLQLYFLKAGYSVIERNRVDKLLSEIEFQNSSATASDDPVEVGKILNVTYVVYGTANYDITGGSPFIKQCTLKMTKVETGETVLISNWEGAGLHVGQVSKRMGNDIYSKLVK